MHNANKIDEIIIIPDGEYIIIGEIERNN